MVDLQTPEVLSKAVARLTTDQKRRAFFTSPFELAYQRHSEADWLAPISRQLEAGDYVPVTPATYDIPKPNWHVRPGANLSLDDQLVYHFAALGVLPYVAPVLAPTERTIRFSYSLSRNSNEWFTRTFAGWDSFRKRSLELLDVYPFALVTDISGYYENIDIQRLVAELRASGVPEPTTSLLSRCLNKWAEPRHRGIPQGQSPSDLLAEFYLTSLDRQLKSEGIVHLRYMDDIRVFGRDEWDIRRALHRITSLLRDRGLNIQTAKSKVLPAAEARASFDGVAEIVQRLSSEILKQVLKDVPDLGYLDWSEIQAFLAANPAAPPADVIREAWAQFSKGELGGFNKTLFHYLLRRLGSLGAADAIPYSLRLLREQPEETQFCLEYLTSVNASTADIAAVGSVLQDPNTLFEYQKLQILKWLYETNLVDATALNYSRLVLRDGRDKLLRLYAAAYVAKSNDLADYDLLQAAYRSWDGWNERASIVCAMSAAPAAIKNPFFARVAGEHPLIDRSLKWAKTDRKPVP